MKRFAFFAAILILLGSFFAFGSGSSSSEDKDKALVNTQQEHYQDVLPTPYFDYSIPRDVLIQIYEVVTTKAYTTYSVIESVTGKVFYHGPSIGYGIPVDTSLTNPLQGIYVYNGAGSTIEQAEPNGLFSSKNTDGTWVLFLQRDGTLAPIYTEHKVTTFPFVVKMLPDGSWARADEEPVEFTVEIGK